jgi:hypothetical protein
MKERGIMPDAGRPMDRSPLARDEPPERPAQVRVWCWTGQAISSFDYQWPDDDRTLQRFVDQHGFLFEFRAGTDHYPIAEAYSRDVTPDSDSFPFQYLVAVLFGSHYEIVLLEHLPALFDVLRYLDPVINR